MSISNPTLREMYKASRDLCLPSDDIEIPAHHYAELQKTADAAMFIAHLVRGAFLQSENAEIKPEAMDSFVYGNLLNTLSVLTTVLSTGLEELE